MIAMISSHQFKTLHVKPSATGLPTRAAKGPDGAWGVRKTAIESVEKLNDRTLGFTLSTASLDRDDDTVSVAGWQLDNYARNPVVLWSHRADELPIGKAIDFGRDERRLFSSVKFLPGGYGAASDLADTIYRMAVDGYLAATSVGFRPVKWEFTEDETRGGGSWFPGIDFLEQELVEFSIVTVPSNPDALIDGAIPIEPGGGDNDVSPVIVPAPAQLLDFDRHRRRARAALLGVFPAAQHRE